ncbi:hypothetical protein QJS10_CPB14g01760 [Acorus calamus]|uniref:Uncharacterized protein n=1 Tax=Acorus calamus TaxID=4465 RepID=A0AAV9D9N9_ACOCL|nr:hypothetical protein QJS10_CPB14g01760 [Acorus calamus]
MATQSNEYQGTQIKKQIQIVRASENQRSLKDVGLHTFGELKAMMDMIKSSQLKTIDLTENDLVKELVRDYER